MANTLKFGNGNWATKEDSVLAYNDENNNFKPLPFDFTRASTATYVDSDGLIKTSRNGEARIDYTDSTDGALLLEPSRTNLITYSEDFSQYLYGGTAPTLTAGQLAPDGTYNATKVSGVIGSTSLYKNSESSTTASRSIYARTVSGTGTARLTSYNSNANNLFSLTEEWQRFELTGSSSTGGVNFYAADFRGSQTLSEFIIWGAQSEEGSYPTSYIPTSGSSVTRAAETCSQTPPSGIIGQTEGTMFVEYDQNIIGQSATRRIIALTDGSINNRIVLYVSSSNKIEFFVRNSIGQLFYDTSLNVNTKGNHKIAAAYKDGDYVVYLDGVEIISGAGSSGTIPACNRIDLGSQLGFSSLFEPINNSKLYNTRLTNAELQTLTT